MFGSKKHGHGKNHGVSMSDRTRRGHGCMHVPAKKKKKNLYLRHGGNAAGTQPLFFLKEDLIIRHNQCC